MRNRLTWRNAASLSIGDRNLPLEMDLQSDVIRQHPMIGRTVEVSPIAGGDLFESKGKNGEVTGVFLRYGEVVGYELTIDGKSYIGTAKDLFVDRAVLVDIQPPTATSASIREALSFWREPRTYWGTRVDGLEALCFELASVTPQAIPECYPWGWRFLVPDPMPGEYTVVDCRVVLHGNFWTMAVMVYPERQELEIIPTRIPDHWARVFSWSHFIGKGMVAQGFPWEGAVQGLETRAKASAAILRPLVESTMNKALVAKERLTGVRSLKPDVCSAFSEVRLKAATIGLTEPPTDRRAYTIVSVSPGAASKAPGHLQQVVLHECIHIVVGSKGGEPHNDEFLKLAEILGLSKENRD